MVRTLWSGMPPDVRREMEITLGGFIKLFGQNPASAKDLLTLVARMAEPAINPYSTVAVVGPVNAGKSTLYNALVTREQDRAETSPVPGTTRENKTADLGLFNLVDTPGADHGSTAVGDTERGKAMKAATEADFLVVVFDAARSVTASDREFYKELLELRKPHVVVLNKMDLVESSRTKVIEASARVLGLDPEELLPTSATRGKGVDKLVLEIAAAEPRLLGKLGEYMVPLRRKLGWQCVRRSTIGAALVALTPIPFMDIIPLTGIQASMVLTLARIYNQELGVTRAFELLTTFGAGWLARLAFQEISKVAGAPGWAISASVAATATMAIGYACMRWFETGEKPTREDMASFTREAQSKVTGMLKDLGKRRPDRDSLTGELEAGLPEVTAPFEEDDEPS